MMMMMMRRHRSIVDILTAAMWLQTELIRLLSVIVRIVSWLNSLFLFFFSRGMHTINDVLIRYSKWIFAFAVIRHIILCTSLFCSFPPWKVTWPVMQTESRMPSQYFDRTGHPGHLTVSLLRLCTPQNATICKPIRKLYWSRKAKLLLLRLHGQRETRDKMK